MPAASTPAAPPDSTVVTGRAAALAAVITSPAESMISTGQVMPSSRRWQLESAQVLLHHRADERGDHGGHRPLVLARLGPDVGGAGHGGARHRGAQRGGHRPFVVGVGVGVQQTDRDPVGRRGGDARDQRVHRLAVERDEHVAPCVDAFSQLEGQAGVHDGGGRAKAQVVPVVLDAGLASQAEHVGESLGGDQRDGPTGPLQDHVGGERRPVHEAADGARGDPGFGEHGTDSLQDAAARVVRGGQHLPDPQATPPVGEHDIGERAADVDTEEVRAGGAVRVVAHDARSATTG